MAPMVELRLLGSLEITDARGQPVSAVLAQPKRAALLAYLALATPHGFQRRDTILALFWPEADTQRARHALNQSIHHLRSGIGTCAITTRGAEEVGLDPTIVRCDVRGFRAALATGRLEEGLGLYRGDLLPGFHIDASVEFDQWLEQVRGELQRAALGAAATLATRSEEQRDIAGAVRWARQACAIAPGDEACSRQLIRLLVRSDGRGAAHAEFARLRDRLHRDFDAQPSPETAALLGGRADTFTVPPSTALAHEASSAPGDAVVIQDPRRRRPLRVAAVAMLALGPAASWWLLRPPVPGSAQSVAIAPFAVPTGDTALVRLGQSLVTTIGANLDEVGEFRVADGIAMLSGAKSRGALLSALDAIALARRLDATSVVHGTLVAEGRLVRADAVLYDVADPRRELAHVDVTAPADNLGALTDSLSWALLRAIWARGRPPTPSVEAVTTHNATAMRAFLEGERLLAHNSVREAAAAYRRAANADTAFAFAHYRYWSTCALMSLRADPVVVARMRRHLHDLPERERALVEAMEIPTVTERREAHRRIVAQYPTYVDGWEALGDYLMHVAIVSRYDPMESLAAWQQVARLRPDEEGVAEALTYACLMADDPCLKTAWARYDSMMRADTSRGTRKRGHRRFLVAFADTSRRIVDSLIDIAARDSLLPMGFGPLRLPLMRAAIRRPQLIRDWDLIMQADVTTRGIGSQVENLMLLASRGEWAAVDSAIDLQRRFGVADGRPLRALRLRVIGELLGELPAAPWTAAEALAVPPQEPRDAYMPMRVMWSDGEANTVFESNWIAGLNALLRGDVAGYGQRLAFLSRDTSAAAAIAARSLRAIQLGRSGHRRVAAESLLVLERQHGERLTKVWGAFAADRILAAQWLVEQGRYASADSLLRFTDGTPLAGMYEASRAIFAPAMLLLSRIAEAAGHRAEAARFAATYLVAYDKAPPADRARRDEAVARVARMQAARGGLRAEQPESRVQGRAASRQ